VGLNARCLATRASINRDELAGLHIELFLLPNLPFVEAFAAQGDAPGALTRFAFAKRQDLAHSVVAVRGQARCTNSTTLPSGSRTIAMVTPGISSWRGMSKVTPAASQAAHTSSMFVI